jgi:hypothetical protein
MLKNRVEIGRGGGGGGRDGGVVLIANGCLSTKYPVDARQGWNGIVTPRTAR